MYSPSRGGEMGVDVHIFDWEYPRLAFDQRYLPPSVDRVAKIPDKDVDVLITHGAPKGICDTINNTPVGCPVLLRKVRTLRPRLHIFGHVHCQTVPPHGDRRAFVDPKTGTIYVNACNLADFAPKPGGRLFPPVVIDLPMPRKPSKSA